MITHLQPHQIFVFGSNTRGVHGAGAARQAAKQFGAEYGIGEGLTGRSYAFPTLDDHLEKRSDAELKQSVALLYAACEEHAGMEFLLTKVGCGLAGFTEEYIRSLFVNQPSNLTLPGEWTPTAHPTSAPQEEK